MQRNQDKSINLDLRSQPSDPLHDKIQTWVYECLNRSSNWVKMLRANSPIVTECWLRGLEKSAVSWSEDWNHEILDLTVRAKLEEPVVQYTKNYHGYQSKQIGFIDVLIQPTFQLNLSSANGKAHQVEVCGPEIFIEVKSHLNLMSTLRQVKMYKEAATLNKKDLFAVCAPPDPKAVVLLEQGIWYIPHIPERELPVFYGPHQAAEMRAKIGKAI